MNPDTIKELVKARLGISSTVRDSYITAIVNGILKELEDEKGLSLDDGNPNHLIFVVDYAAWRYQSKDSPGDMPRHLQFRMNNMFIHAGRPPE